MFTLFPGSESGNRPATSTLNRFSALQQPSSSSQELERRVPQRWATVPATQVFSSYLNNKSSVGLSGLYNFSLTVIWTETARVESAATASTAPIEVAIASTEGMSEEMTETGYRSPNGASAGRKRNEAGKESNAAQLIRSAEWRAWPKSETEAVAREPGAKSKVTMCWRMRGKAVIFCQWSRYSVFWLFMRLFCV